MQDIQPRKRPEDVIFEFTADDYRGVTPYEWLYSFRDSKFQTERLRGVMVADAKKKGVSNAGVMWRKYLADQLGGRSSDLAQNVTEFSGQPVELLCGEYGCFDEGVSRCVQRGETPEEVTVCAHPILPVARLVNIETGECKTEIAFRRGAGWRRMVFDKATLSNARSITALASCGISVTSETARELVRYLSVMEDLNYDELPEIKTIGRLGWVDGYGFSPYVDGLQYDAAGMYGDAFSAVHSHGDYKVWRNIALDVRAGQSVPCRIALAASFASALVSKVGALPFICHLWGSVSGIGKSVGLILAASVWAYPEIGSYVKTTKSTSVGYEQMAAFCGHMPLCMDELQMIQGKKEFDELIYMLCEGVSKTRGAKAGGVQQVQRWRNAIITTGEQPITSANSKAGAVNRVLELECSDKLFPDPRAAYQLLIQNYGHAGKLFVKALNDSPDVMETVEAYQQAFYERLQGHATDKQVLTASLILAADQLADDLLFEDGNSLTAEEIIPYLVTKKQADTNERAYEWLCDMVASNPIHFETDSSGQYRGECWGCISGDYVYMIKSIFDREMNAAGFNPQSFLSWANKKKMLETSSGRLTKTKRICGATAPTRCAAVRLPKEEDSQKMGKTPETLEIQGDLEVDSVFQQMEM